MKFHPFQYRSRGSIFSSPKLMTGASSNPFAVRSSPGRLNDGTDTQNHAASSIIAPSKFGSLATCHSANESQTAAETSECNGTATPLRSVLRPPMMGTPSTFSSPSILKPSTLGNPFSRPVDLEESPGALVKDSGRKTEAPVPSKPSFLMPSRLGAITSDASSGTTENGRSAEGSEKTTQVLADTSSSTSLVTVPVSTGNLFASALTTGTTSAPAPNNFVFGQKLYERVENANHAVDESKSNGASPSVNLFTVIAKEKNEAETVSTNGTSKTLSDSARELEEARAAKRKYDEVAVVTGEEDEQNALQIYGKLFTFDKVQGTWTERGRGTLRLNDKQLDDQTLQSRLVMRTQGCLRVILNTKIWPEMTIEKTSDKSLRLTAADGDQIRVFLVMASLKDTDLLLNALEWRLTTLRAQQARTGTATKTDSHSAATLGGPLTSEEELLEGSTPKRRSIDHEESSGEEAKKKRSED